MKIERFVEMLSSWATQPSALHHRLTEAIENAIVQGFLLPGMRLPAKRSLAEALSVSRTTIVTAYSNLRDHGWLESRTGSGTWVATRQAMAARSRAHTGVVSRGSIGPAKLTEYRDRLTRIAEIADRYAGARNQATEELASTANWITQRWAESQDSGILENHLR
jgi:DNA-binding GntR family transcriptional regulator